MPRVTWAPPFIRGSVCAAPIPAFLGRARPNTTHLPAIAHRSGAEGHCRRQEPQVGGNMNVSSTYEDLKVVSSIVTEPTEAEVTEPTTVEVATAEPVRDSSSSTAAARLLEIAARNADQLLTEAQAEADEMKASARVEADEVLTEART